MASLKDIRARLAAQENKSTFTGDNTVYPHWTIDEGSQAILRLLPDKDETNPFFWVERAMIKLPFAGVKDGDMASKQVIVQVPCMEMYGPNEVCPVLAEVRPWFKDKSLEDMGRKYWKKRSYLYQGFVHQDPLGEEDAPENPIRRFMISPQIHNIIKNSLMDPELEDLPTDYDNGLDLRISKGSKGGYADYSTSNWSRKESALTEAELEAIETFGLNDLKSFLPKKPGAVELEIIKEMFEASVDGQPYDLGKWGKYYRPSGFNVPETKKDDELEKAVSNVEVKAKAVSNVEVKAKVEAKVEDDIPFNVEPEVKVEAKDTASKAEDILAQIRARQQA